MNKSQNSENLRDYPLIYCLRPWLPSMAIERFKQPAVQFINPPAKPHHLQQQQVPDRGHWKNPLDVLARTLVTRRIITIKCPSRSGLINYNIVTAKQLQFTALACTEGNK